MNQGTKDDVERRLKRIAGQVAGIQRMVESDRYCVDVLLQVAAVRAALNKASKLLLESHIRTCLRGAFDGPHVEEREAKMAELVKVFDKNCS